MARKRCIHCQGSGKIMGGGMMLQDCDECYGSGKVEIVDEANDIDYLVSKQSDAYKAAKSKIKALDENMSDAEAEKLLDDGLSKTEKKTKK